MSEITQHVFEGAEVRVVVGEDGEPWFVASDVARVLGYERPADAIRAHCKGVGETQTPTAGGLQTVNIIPERDLYRLIMRSRLPGAERFEEWVVGQVLPSIRKTGSYATQAASAAQMAALADPAFLRGLLGDYAERVLTLEATVATSAPKVDVYDRIVSSGDTLGFREAAKVIREATGANEREVMALMLKRGWIQRLGGKPAPAHYGEAHGYATTRMDPWTDDNGVTHVKPVLRITPKGTARLITVLLNGGAA